MHVWTKFHDSTSKWLWDTFVQILHFWTVAIAPHLGQSVQYLLSVNPESAATAVVSLTKKHASGLGCVSQTWWNNNNKNTNNYNRLPSHFVLGTLMIIKSASRLNRNAQPTRPANPSVCPFRVRGHEQMPFIRDFEHYWAWNWQCDRFFELLTILRLTQNIGHNFNF